METRQVFGDSEIVLQNQFRPVFCARCGAKLEYRLRYGEMRDVCPDCGFVHYVRPAAAVAVVVVKDAQVLLCRRAAALDYGGLWCLPSGAIELDEDFLTAGLRETLEETGVQVEIKGLLSVTSNFFPHGVSTLVPVLVAEPVLGEPRPTPESEAVEWFNPTALPEMAFEGDRQAVLRYFAHPDAIVPIEAAYASAEAAASRRRPPPVSLHARRDQSSS